MIPGEVITEDGDVELNAGAEAVTLEVANTGDRAGSTVVQLYAADLSADRPVARLLGFQKVRYNALKFPAPVDPGRILVVPMADGVHDGLVGEIRWRDDAHHVLEAAGAIPDHDGKVQKYA